MDPSTKFVVRRVGGYILSNAAREDAGHAVALSFGTRYEGSNIRYSFAGEASGEAMQGTVALGTSTDHHQGPVNLAQFGSAQWRAVRLG